MNKIIQTKSKTLKNYDATKFVVLFACCLINIISYSIPQYGTPLTLSSLSEFVTDNKMFLIGLMFLVASLINLLISPYVNKIFRFVNIKALFSIGIIINGLGFMCFGLAQFATHNLGAGIVTIYTAQTCVTIGSMIFSTISIPLVINQWFSTKQKGMAIGLSTSAIGVGAMIWQVVIQNCLKSKALGYDSATNHLAIWNVYFIFGSIIIIAGILITVTMIKVPKTDAYKNAADQKNFVYNEPKHEDIGPGYQVLKRNPWFWCFLFGFFLTSIGIGTWGNMYVTFLEDGLGWDDNPKKYEIIGYVGFFFATGNIIGNSIGGTLFDKFKSSKMWAFACLMRILGMFLLLVSAVKTYAIFGAGFFCGLGTLSYRTGRSFIAIDLFKKKDISKILSMVAISFSLGYCISLPILNGIADSGSTSYLFGVQCNRQWEGAWIFAISALSCGALLTWIMIKRINKLGTRGMQYDTVNRYTLFEQKEKFWFKFTSWFFWYIGYKESHYKKWYRHHLQRLVDAVYRVSEPKKKELLKNTIQNLRNLIGECNNKKNYLKSKQNKKLSRYRLQSIKIKTETFLDDVDYRLKTFDFNYNKFYAYYTNPWKVIYKEILEQLTIIYEGKVWEQHMLYKLRLRSRKHKSINKIEKYYNKFKKLKAVILHLIDTEN
ncbi:MFS transporter [Ureaplasma ceti]|uniref:MFS transporter n=1 Tax=Ureaplasma ceti TaxID=3119530 RepID=A0ABP9U5G5_9BACT